MLMIAALLAGHLQPQVLSILEGEEFVRWGIVAELVVRPAGIPDEQFAQQLIDAEGLKPTGQQMNFPAVNGHMATKAVFSSDGREVIVKYVPADAKQPGKVCRFRLAQGGMVEARWRAYRWCAKAFGLTLPQNPPPIVRMDQVPQ